MDHRPGHRPGGKLDSTPAGFRWYTEVQ
jgi:hypothetical protein